MYLQRKICHAWVYVTIKTQLTYPVPTDLSLRAGYVLTISSETPVSWSLVGYLHQSIKRQVKMNTKTKLLW